MKIQIFICGEGLGHTTRSLAAGKELIKAGHNVQFCAYGYSKEHIEKEGYSAIKIPSEIKLVGRSGYFDIKDSIEETLKSTDILAYPKLLRVIKKGKPDLIISDSYFLAVIAGKILRKRVFIILNQTNVKAFFENRGINVKLVGRIVNKFSDSVLRRVDKILIPDFLPPFTVCGLNLNFSQKLLDRVVYTGPLVRQRPSEVKGLNLKKPHVFSTVGGFGYRERLFRNILSIAKLQKHIHFTLVAGPNVDVNVLKEHSKNVEIIPYLNDPFQYIKSTDMVIAPGGHSTLMECLSFGKPVLSFPDIDHSEQENNVEMIEKLGVGKHMSYLMSDFMITDCIEEMLNDKKIKKNCKRMEQFAKKLDGAKRVVKMIEGQE